jgi:hypothetical protein
MNSLIYLRQGCVYFVDRKLTERFPHLASHQ